MNHLSSKIPYSILDLATVTEGASLKETFSKSQECAQHAEKLGYNRYWLSEHHNMISVASSATSILIGYIAGGTSTMRVGSGGIMLPNHSPLAVAEQFGTLESIYPGRIDLGLGRAPGTDQLTAMELRGTRSNTAEDFPQNILKLKTFFSKENSDSKVRAIPGEGQDIPLWILGSSTDSAQLAGYLGLPYAFASHFAPAQFYAAIEIYRRIFRPSPDLQQAYVMPCVNVIAADTDEEASRLATSLYQMFIGIITGRRTRLQPPVDNMHDIWTEYEEEAAKQMLQLSLIGSPDTIKARLKILLEKTGMNEIMIISNIYDQKAKLYSYELFADIMKEL
ncbi:LLM class flavin-dependent oxidoreductase [Hanamia caeni]|jgi:luciferase family oxidoreductase group 1|uniref:Luciferase-like monooxygenase n=1 Tax=Hanamia caeni TaxID=2294116 RepID=A0A3M9ND37_9BACT|nr:LLM class flavin-dependent oxidoreductase [Hanamia caeni]RNI35676.1 LLM class flavin-dependent oxidoreductase [Hanamia caeni]